MVSANDDFCHADEDYYDDFNLQKECFTLDDKQVFTPQLLQPSAGSIIRRAAITLWFVVSCSQFVIFVTLTKNPHHIIVM